MVQHHAGLEVATLQMTAKDKQTIRNTKGIWEGI